MPLEAVVRKINCELEIATSNAVKNNRQLKDWQLTYTITLKANEIGGVGSSTNTFPIFIAPTVLANLGFGGSYTQTANRTAIFKFDSDVSNLCSQTTCSQVGMHPFVSGEIGFREWLARAVDAATDRGLDPSGLRRLSSVSHTFEFSVQTVASASAGFLITPSNRTTALNPGVSGERFDDHIVEIVFAKPAPSSPPTVITVMVPVLSEQQKEEIASIRREQARQRRIMVELDNKRFDFEKNLKSLGREDTNLMTTIKENQLNAKRLDFEAISGNAKIEKIKKNPEDREANQKIIPSSSGSPLTNPNLSSSLLQLQLERLNTTLTRGVGRF